MFDLNTKKRIPQIGSGDSSRAPPREKTLEREESVPMFDLNTGKKNDQAVLKSNPRRPDKVYRSYKDDNVREQDDLDIGYKPTWLTSTTATTSKPTAKKADDKEAGYKPTWLSSTTTSKAPAKKAVPVRVI